MRAFRALDRQVLDGIEVDAEALKKLTNRDGETFEAWCAKHEKERRAYAKEVMVGYPPAHMAAASATKWEGMLAYCMEQRAVSRAFRRRAVAVCRALLSARKIKATEAEAEARTWEQDEEAERWEALAGTLTEWLREARAAENTFQAKAGSGHRDR